MNEQLSTEQPVHPYTYLIWPSERDDRKPGKGYFYVPALLSLANEALETCATAATPEERAAAYVRLKASVAIAASNNAMLQESCFVNENARLNKMLGDEIKKERATLAGLSGKRANLVSTTAMVVERAGYKFDPDNPSLDLESAAQFSFEAVASESGLLTSQGPSWFYTVGLKTVAVCTSGLAFGYGYKLILGQVAHGGLQTDLVYVLGAGVVLLMGALSPLAKAVGDAFGTSVSRGNKPWLPTLVLGAGLVLSLGLAFVQIEMLVEMIGIKKAVFEAAKPEAYAIADNQMLWCAMALAIPSMCASVIGSFCDGLYWQVKARVIQLRAALIRQQRSNEQYIRAVEAMQKYAGALKLERACQERIVQLQEQLRDALTEEQKLRVTKMQDTACAANQDVDRILERLSRPTQQPRLRRSWLERLIARLVGRAWPRVAPARSSI